MDDKGLVVSKDIIDEIIYYCYSKLPYEACGFLSGREAGTRIWKLENQLQSRNQFFVDKETIRKTIIDTDKLGETLLATFHSHPTSAPTPSRSDIFNHLSEDIFMIIISFKYETPQIVCYKISNDSYLEYPIITKPPL